MFFCILFKTFLIRNAAALGRQTSSYHRGQRTNSGDIRPTQSKKAILKMLGMYKNDQNDLFGSFSAGNPFSGTNNIQNQKEIHILVVTQIVHYVCIGLMHLSALQKKKNITFSN